MLSGCGTLFDPGDYKISGIVTGVDQTETISGVTINYRINSRSWRTINIYEWDHGKWSFRANHGDKVTIWAQKPQYSFQPAPYHFKVTEDRNDLKFEVTGWFDDFSDSSSGWSRQGFSDYIFGQYEIVVSPPYTSVKTLAPLKVPTSYTIEAEMISEDGNGGYGFAFNISGQRIRDFYHIFRVNPNGDQASGYVPYYELLKATIDSISSEGVILSIETLVKVNDTSYRFIDLNMNKLKVKQVWQETWLFINDEEVWSGEIDAELVESLEFGLYAYANTNYVAWYDNLRVEAVGFKPQPQIRTLALSDRRAFQDVEHAK